MSRYGSHRHAQRRVRLDRRMASADEWQVSGPAFRGWEIYTSKDRQPIRTASTARSRAAGSGISSSARTTAD